jgi:aspartate/methionine/tyrosine aminotransferase
MAVPGHLIEAVNKIQDTILICAPVVSQFAAVGALAAGRPYCLEKLREIGEVRRLVLSRLREISDIAEAPAADGAFYVLLRLKTEMDSMQIVEKLVREHRVAAIPGGAFGLEHGAHLRIAYGALRPGTAEEGAGRLVRGLREVLR